MTQTFAAANHTRGVLAADEAHRLEYICAQARRDVVETLGYIGSGHSGPSLSIIEMLVTLYFNEMRLDPHAPKWPDRDRDGASSPERNSLPLSVSALDFRGIPTRS